MKHPYAEASNTNYIVALKGFGPGFNHQFLLGHFNTDNSILLVHLAHKGPSI